MQDQVTWSGMEDVILHQLGIGVYSQLDLVEEMIMMTNSQKTKQADHTHTSRII